MTFELLVATATDIIKGKCVGVDKKDDYVEYEFVVINRYLGEEVEDNIFVYVPDYAVTVINTDYSYRLSDLTYKEGSEYYLVLSKHVDVYLPHDRYINVGGNLFMPANDISHSTLYGETLINHAQTKSINAEKDLTDYLSKITTNNHVFIPCSFIQIICNPLFGQRVCNTLERAFANISCKNTSDNFCFFFLYHYFPVLDLITIRYRSYFHLSESHPFF